jgi:two-component system sensor histidine kinase CreC
VQTLTHEVKSPLSAIRGAAELLQEPMPEAQRQYFLNNIQRETLRIQEMVDRMMELTALETRRVLDRVQPVDLAALLHELLATRHSSAAQRHIGIHLTPAPDAWVEGDPFLLRQALSNLLDNALDFAPTGSTIEVMLWALQRQVLVAISDQGPGIPDYAQDKVFEKFYSLARPQSQKKSTGLGLSFVQEIASLHHGRIELKNRPAAQGLGAVATLTLPRMATKT